MACRSTWWESPDGSKVLSYFPHDANDVLQLARDYTIAQKQAAAAQPSSTSISIGDHGGGPTRARGISLGRAT